MKLGSLLSTGVIGFQNSRGQMGTPSLKTQGEHDYCNTDQGWNDNCSPLTCQDPWQWLIDHGVTKNNTDQQQIRTFFGLYNHTEIENL